MRRAIRVAVVAAAVLTAGCAQDQVLLRPGDNPDLLALAIARQGAGENPPETTPEPEGSFWARDCFETTGKICAACLYLCMELIYGAAKHGY